MLQLACPEGPEQRERERETEKELKGRAVVVLLEMRSRYTTIDYVYYIDYHCCGISPRLVASCRHDIAE